MIRADAGEKPETEIRSPLPVAVRRPLRILFFVITCLMAVFAVGGFFVPREMKVERTMQISAPAVEIFDRLQSFKKWEDWAPWFRRDPFLEKQFAGPDAGTGALMEWSSKNDGRGKIKIVTANVASRLNMAVDFGEYGDGVTWFELTDGGNGTTQIDWGFSVDFGQNLARRYFGLWFRSKVARDFEEGLVNLKELMERPSK